MTTKAQERHPFGELLAQYRARKSGLTQTHLAELAGYDQAVLVRMVQGKKDLTGPSGRARVVRLITTLADHGALTTLDEANGLLLSANMAPLFEREPAEAQLITRLIHIQSAYPSHHVRRTNLPAPLTHFIGRAQEADDIRRLLSTTRLLTLTGSGGAGKTRLAQRVAADALIGYSDGVWYVELAVLTDPALIADAVAHALGLTAADRPPQDQVTDYLRDRHVLLVLDNCEHLIAAVAALSIALLRACPRLTILATSREALDTDGETAWRVPPMQPDEAARLFVERAQAARGDVALSAQDETVVHICRRLDGMPLAIELAAARLRGMSLRDLAARLDDRFALLTEGRRGALPRHQTLRALIDWSYGLLTEPERVLLRRLAVFVGGWTAEIAAAVVVDPTDDVDTDPLSTSAAVRPTNVLSLLLQLINKSLVVVEEHGGETRYRYLETIREYARERLAEHGELAALQRRHAETLLAWADRSVKFIHGPEQRTWLPRVEREYANLRAALTWSFDPNSDAMVGCRMIGALYHFWYMASGHGTEARQWTAEGMRALSEDMPYAVRAWILLSDRMFSFNLDSQLERSRRVLELFEATGDPVNSVWGRLTVAEALYYVGDYPASLQLHEEAVVQARELGDDWVLRFCLEMLGQCLRFAQQDIPWAEAAYRESMELSRTCGDLHQVARILAYYIGGFAQERLQFRESLNYAEEALDLARQVDDPAIELSARCLIAENIRYLDDVPRAVALFEDCLDFVRERLTEFDSIGPLIYLARAVNALGDHIRAHALLDKALRLRRTRPMPYGAYGIFDAMAVVAAVQGDALRAAHLRGAADTMIALNHHYRAAHLQWEYAPYIDKARAALGDATYEAAYAEGRSMSVERAVEYALEG